MGSLAVDCVLQQFTLVLMRGRGQQQPGLGLGVAVGGQELGHNRCPMSWERQVNNFLPQTAY